MLTSPTRPQLWLLVLLALCLAQIAPADDPAPNLDYFEREVRPILVDACFKCHAADKQESDLRLDSRERILQGGVSGPALIPGQPNLSMASSCQEGAPEARLSW